MKNRVFVAILVRLVIKRVRVEKVWVGNKKRFNLTVLRQFPLRQKFVVPPQRQLAPSSLF